MDNFISMHLAGAFIINVFMECLLLYILVWERDFYQDDLYITIMISFWLTIIFLSLATDLILSAMVNSTVSLLLYLINYV